MKFLLPGYVIGAVGLAEAELVLLVLVDEELELFLLVVAGLVAALDEEVVLEVVLEVVFFVVAAFDEEVVVVGYDEVCALALRGRE